VKGNFELPLSRHNLVTFIDHLVSTLISHGRGGGLEGVCKVHTQVYFCCVVMCMMVYLQQLISPTPIALFIVFVCAKKPNKHWRNPVCRHSMSSEWFYPMRCELSGPPSGQFSIAWLGRERGACVLCVRVPCVREGRHCSLTSPLSPACRCSQTRLCYSSTGDRPSAKHGAPPADPLERGAGRKGSRTCWGWGGGGNIFYRWITIYCDQCLYCYNTFFFNDGIMRIMLIWIS